MYTEDKTLRELVKKYAPEGFTNKKRIEVEACTTLRMTSLNWSGGYRNVYVGVKLDTGEYTEVEPPDFRTGGSHPPISMVEGVAFICYTYSGINKYVTVYVHPSNLTQQLPPAENLTDRQIAVLYFTRGYKNTYGGRTDIRRQEACLAGYNFTREEWIEEQANLVKMGLLDTRGSLTTKGRNVTPNSLVYKNYE